MKKPIFVFIVFKKYILYILKIVFEFFQRERLLEVVFLICSLSCRNETIVDVKNGKYKKILEITEKTN